jgi:pimeloyl-ACP methyl ester carboxylesterase
VTERRVLAALLGVATLLASLAAPAAAATNPPPATLHWSSCQTDFQCARLSVPLDDTVAHSPTISLALMRIPATDPSHRIGSLVVNPGGPGPSAVQYIHDEAQALPAAVRARFDVVGFDSRGTGGSAPLHCTSHLDSFYNLEFAPTNDAARQALVAGAQALVNDCQAKDGAELPYLSTERTARDMDRVRAALGDAQLTYLGFSYGTYLGTLYADRYPTHVRAMVLDGAVDLALPAATQQIQQAQGFERDLDLFLASCSTDTSCAFHRDGHAAAAYDALRARLDQAPIPASGAGNGRTLNGTEFDIAVATFLYSGRSGWSDLAQALDTADQGDGSDMLTASDQYTERHSDGSYNTWYAAFLAIGCVDGPAVGGLAGLRAIEDQAAIAAPRLGRSVVNDSFACALWPVAAQTPPLPHAAGAPPIVVIGNTDDPATPLAGAQALAAELQSGVLVTVNSVQHTAYASGNGCVDSIVNRYLITRAAPPPGQHC